MNEFASSAGGMAADSTGGSSGAERRHGPDRRRRPTPMLSRYWLRGRRRGARRSHEAVGIYIDRYTPGEWALVALVTTLSIADLWLTWLHLLAGGAELNPLLDRVLQDHGVLAFAAAKLGLTTIPLFFLLLHVRFPRVRPALVGVLALYAGVLAWHAVVAVDRAGLA